MTLGESHMTKKTRTAASPDAKRRITIERTYQASIEDVWDLWTTKDGIESWWGPEGFTVKVRKLDLRPGGALEYAMTATALEQIEFMKGAGMPLTTEARLIYKEVAPRRRLAYEHLADFIPGVEPYTVASIVELQPGAQGVRMVLTFDPMHDEQWTQRMVMGWESQLGKLAKALAA
jgi:uncharacterized protein YndB with AHSA1/START domain